ncbi:MAG: hypothetical protein US60_C0053G0009 [Microgenomates group bacterium GW2011_GWC1_37_8]|uniref:Uncharacterized protein n=1 Tax=Candidatus Woesebacteria bacterium GW2011_GWB1_38_8 TaxID=1618570 RepID=A0A0G0LA23_9BACT|nr:MAG: hypothetical protein US60_C0053G0009 [Microgenomates group bacterium GW2011_GWC1_37_8]KKQ84695.1 MAG: hypothetical protein UT08_C0015G0031 [Candidatus Woesebacteria bacterium GW2011_GWB1_38_8]
MYKGMSKKAKSKKKAKRQTSGLVKILEAVVIIGSLAAIIIKFFKVRKSKK